MTMSYENDLITKIAWKYYIEGLTQNEISESLNLSRMKVIKYLEKAKANHVIQFRIDLEKINYQELQQEIKEKYQLKDIYIVPASNDTESENFTLAAAQYIEDRITGDTLISIGYGEAVSKTLGHLRISTKYNVTFVSLSGGVKFYMPTAIDTRSDYYTNPNYKHYIIPSPLMVSSEKLAKEMLAEKPIRNVLEMIPHSNMTIMGIGALNDKATIVKEGYLNSMDIDIIKTQGAAGDMLSQFYDINGDLIDLDLHKQLISSEIGILKSLNHVVAVAGGAHKREAIIGALKGGYIDVLITDEAAARGLVE
ncbi:sugar-binding transcriptional regulator [Bacillus infantis]|uniref:sugar-binding transcriptional regulator n=1 Tax=Bacillus infantis TaxID=324767 RepID=UPI003CF25FA4